MMRERVRETTIHQHTKNKELQNGEWVKNEKAELKNGEKKSSRDRRCYVGAKNASCGGQRGQS